MSGSDIEIEIAGVGARLSTSYRELAEYADVHLSSLKRRDTRLEVTATLRWHEGAPPGHGPDVYPELAEMQRIDRDLYRGERSLAWFRVDELPGLYLRFERDGSRLVVEGDYHYCLSRSRVRDRLKRFVYRNRLAELRQRRFTTLLYYLVYYPCFWWLEHNEECYPIHAAGVEIDGEVIVLAGPSGVGKSTVTVALAASPGARLLSDTFLLHRGPDVRPVREPILLGDWSRQWLGEVAKKLQPIRWRYCLDRGGFGWPVQELSDGGRARVILFPQRATHNYVRPIPPREAHALLSAGDFVVNDLRRYWAYAAVLEMLERRTLMQDREAQLSALTASVPSYEIGLSPEVTREDVVRTILELVRSSRASARLDADVE